MRIITTPRLLAVAAAPVLATVAPASVGVGRHRVITLADEAWRSGCTNARPGG